MTGGGTITTGCAGMINGVERLGFPGMCLANAGNGVGGTDYVSAWPAGVHVAASWNKELTYQRAHGMGGEARVKGVNILLGPVVGPLGRVVEGGRNWEGEQISHDKVLRGGGGKTLEGEFANSECIGFSPDPYLSGQLVQQSVEGVQDAGVVTSTKHFLGYEQETHRLSTTNYPWANPISSNMDDKTIHELYLW